MKAKLRETKLWIKSYISENFPKTIRYNSEDLYGCAASDGTNSAIMVTYYNNQDTSSDDVEIEVINPYNENGAELEFYLLDEDNDNKLFRKETFNSKKHSSILNLKMYSTFLVKIKNL